MTTRGSPASARFKAKPRDFGRKMNYQSASICHRYNCRDLPSARKLDHSFLPRRDERCVYFKVSAKFRESCIGIWGSQESIFRFAIAGLGVLTPGSNAWRKESNSRLCGVQFSRTNRSVPDPG